jgi:hypothetical protein
VRHGFEGGLGAVKKLECSWFSLRFVRFDVKASLDGIRRYTALQKTARPITRGLAALKDSKPGTEAEHGACEWRKAEKTCGWGRAGITSTCFICAFRRSRQIWQRDEQLNINDLLAMQDKYFLIPIPSFQFLTQLMAFLGRAVYIYPSSDRARREH